MTEMLWVAVFAQMAMGGFDTLYHHELTERLAWRPTQKWELRLHGVRNLAYAIMFTALGWTEPHGAVSVAFVVLLAGELVITLWDFVEEDRTRAMPATERLTHTLLTLNYGVILAMLIPHLIQWAALPNAVVPAFHGIASWLCAVAALGVILSGLRDLAAARRMERIVPREASVLASALGKHQRILVTGGTGLIGSRLVAALVGAGHEVTVLTRARGNAAGLPAPLRIVTALDQIAGDTPLDAIVNLAGEPISDAPWTARKRQRILRSRLKATRDVVRLIARLEKHPAVLISGSAIGWYGRRGDEDLDETEGGTDCFSRSLCVRWEKAAAAARALGVRVVSLRTGLVLAAEGGVLSRMLAPFEFGLGGPFGNGHHWMSWIHRDDLVRLIVHTIATPDIDGPVNGTAPSPVRNRDFTAALGRALSRPAVVSMPALPLRLALGAFAEELLLSGQKVLPRVALRSGFRFDYPVIGDAIDAIVGRKRRHGAAAPVFAPSNVQSTAPR